MNAQSGVCTPAGGLVTGEPPHTAPPCAEAVTWEEGAGGPQCSRPGPPLCPGWAPPASWVSSGPRSVVSPPTLPTGVLVLLSLGYLTSLFYYIPKAALAAVIITAVAPLLDTGIARTLWRVRSTWLLVYQCEVTAALPSPTTVPAGAGGPRGSGRCHPGVRGQAASSRSSGPESGLQPLQGWGGLPSSCPPAPDTCRRRPQHTPLPRAGPAAPERDLPALLLGGAVRRPGRHAGVPAGPPALRGQAWHAGTATATRRACRPWAEGQDPVQDPGFAS